MANDLLTVADFVADALDVDDTTTSEVLNASPLVARLPISDTSDGSETHKYNTYTGAPVVGFRAANGSRDYDHLHDSGLFVACRLRRGKCVAERSGGLNRTRRRPASERGVVRARATGDLRRNQSWRFCRVRRVARFVESRRTG